MIVNISSGTFFYFSDILLLSQLTILPQLLSKKFFKNIILLSNFIFFRFILYIK